MYDFLKDIFGCGNDHDYENLMLIKLHRMFTLNYTTRGNDDDVRFSVDLSQDCT